MAKREVFNPLAFKDTFWNRLRVEKGYKLKEIAKYIRVSVGCAGAYFSGQSMPNDEVVQQLCDYFDIDFLKGRHEFAEANRIWDAEHKRTLRIPAKRIERIKPEPKKRGRKKKKLVQEVIIPAPKKPSVLECLYGKVSYDTYKAIMEDSSKLAETLYGKVDFELYNDLVNKKG